MEGDVTTKKMEELSKEVDEPVESSDSSKVGPEHQYTLLNGFSTSGQIVSSKKRDYWWVIIHIVLDHHHHRPVSGFHAMLVK
ncbi:hypothetical protein LWI29_037636 [Acer saccharum]|uniref:Uncharacterized protein n=1 Tax=Acer saccharum TaxID=4024 RepID=A0AA39RJV9_ACESA|nr:hypothetical protein LWI29_037636 [Acer saccharum]